MNPVEAVGPANPVHMGAHIGHGRRTVLPESSLTISKFIAYQPNDFAVRIFEIWAFVRRAGIDLAMHTFD